MRLRRLTAAGFRGFNDERTIEFDERLTLIAAPNSHGKTSVSEALEFLLYGMTSKVQHADSKEEYRDSYRNRHYCADRPSYIEAAFTQADADDVVLRVELAPSGELRRFLNNTVVAQWPFEQNLEVVARPFVLQHALKYLLLAAPMDRFQGFARLLGLNDIDRVHQAIVSLCTKPEASLSQAARRSLAELQSIEGRLAGFPALANAVKALRTRKRGVEAAYKALDSRAEALLGEPGTPPDRPAQLSRAREDAASRVYSGTIAIKATNVAEDAQMSACMGTISTAISAELLADYASLGTHGATERLRKEAHLLDLGTALFDEAPSICPLCGQCIDAEMIGHILERHQQLKRHIAGQVSLDQVRARIETVFRNLRTALHHHGLYYRGLALDLLQATSPANEARVRDLFGTGNEASWEIALSAAKALAPHVERRDTAGAEADAALATCEAKLTSQAEQLSDVEDLARRLHDYLAATDAFYAELNELRPSLVGPARILQQAIDHLAGTGELSLLIDCFARRGALERSLRVRDAVEDLKELKRHVDQTVGETMEAAIDADLTNSVMGWYTKIRTLGDPDVHFSGFAMDRTKSGDFKSRRLRVSAQSYGVELASAVSSLSESKLNALGLCVSIASALRSPGPWEFLVLDDPIQSWDDDHEVQFVDVVRTLVEQEGRQVILLSHKSQWVKSVALGCRSLNGIHYEMTGYTKRGPNVSVVQWSSVEQRIREADTIANDPSATTIRLQQGEQEIRLAVCQIASEVARDRLNRLTSPHNMNGNDVRAIFTEAGFGSALIDRATATFGASDDAHHAPKRYQPSVQRLRQYVAVMRELRNVSWPKRS